MWVQLVTMQVVQEIAAVAVVVAEGRSAVWCENSGRADQQPTD